MKARGFQAAPSRAEFPWQSGFVAVSKTTIIGLLAAAAYAAGATGAWGKIVEGPTVNPANGHTYYVVGPATWTQAEAEAVSLGGHLATVDDGAENAWITSTFAHPYLWIGYTDAGSEGKFTWISGAGNFYENWYSGEPNNAGTGESYVLIYNFDSGGHQWNDMPDVSLFLDAYDIFGVVEVPPLADRQAPAVTLRAPPNNTTYNAAQSVVLLADASDNVGVTRVEFYDSGILRGKGSTNGGSYQFTWTFSSSDTGTHRWVARAYDAAGNVGTSLPIDLIVSIDLDAPTVSIVSPRSLITYDQPQTVVIEATATDNVGVVKVELYDGERVRATMSTPPFRFTWNITEAENGVHNWTARAYDWAGNSRTSASAVLTVNIDKQAPVVSIISPGSDTSFNTAQPLLIEVSASDTGGVVQVEFWDNGSRQGTVTNAPFVFTWNITPADNGLHNWTAYAYDAAGNVGTSKPVRLFVVLDGQPPTVSITSPPTQTIFNTPQTVLIQAAATDNVSVAKVEFYDNGALRSTGVTPPYAHTWTVSSANSGTHTWTARAYDGAGNAQTSAGVTLVVNLDAQSPSVSISSPPANTRFTSAQSVVLRADAQDNVGVTKVEFYDNGSMRGASPSPPFTYTWDFGIADNGTHLWTARAYDAAGHVQDSAEVPLVVSIEAPAVQVSISAPVNNATFGSPQEVDLQITTTGIGIQRVELYRNGAKQATLSVPPYQFAWNITAQDNGTHTWVARAVDAAGKAVDSAPVALVVNIDVLAPTISISLPLTDTLYTTPQAVSIRAIGFDDDGIAKVEFYDNGKLRGTSLAPPYSFTWNITGADDGRHTWTVRASDFTGNAQTSAPITLTVAISALRIAEPALRENVFSVVVATEKGSTYVLEAARALPSPTWLPIQTLEGNGASQVLQDPQATLRRRFYRVSVISR